MLHLSMNSVSTEIALPGTISASIVLKLRVKILGEILGDFVPKYSDRASI